ncbi:putative serine/threonine-protein kinase/receptor [Phytophthora citrophthora]|uniref:Serine/threonine-protein kinase/receptor n=1 Tax=Phytophthora citrophthora TaxID=4793 RepID=A0AAD9GNL6_9STRA|nr:putative serine/threonine-protein kinase/receptor [Phytophthora citrophthora]
MSKKAKPKPKAAVVDENLVTRQIVATNYGKACKAIGVSVNPHVNELFRGKEEDGDLFILEGEGVGALGPGGIHALALAIMISLQLDTHTYFSWWLVDRFTNGPYTQLRYIRIWKQEIGNEGTAAITSLLQATSGVNIAYLELLDCEIGEGGCKALGDILSLQKAPGLLTLNLDYNTQIGDAGVNVLVDSLFSNTALKQLHLDYCGVGPSGCIKLAQLVSLPTCAIEVLSLNGNNIGSEGLHHLSLGLARSQRLVSLNLSDNGIRNNIEALAAFRDALIRSKVLAHVDFTFNLIEPEGANVLLPALAPENAKLQSFLVDASLPGDLFQLLNRSKKAEGKKKDLVVPGSGLIADVLSKTILLCSDMKEGQDACRRVHIRLNIIFEELQKMEKKNILPPSEKLNQYTDVVLRYFLYLERYRQQNIAKRLIKHRAMMIELAVIQEEIEMLFKILNLAAVASMMDWKQQWEADQKAMTEVLESRTRSSVLVLREVPSVRAQSEAILDLKFELEQRCDRQNKEVIQLMKAMLKTVVQASKSTVGKVPQWFLPSNEVDTDSEPFAVGSYGSVYRGTWGLGTAVVVKRFNVEDKVVSERAQRKIEREINIWYLLNHPHVIKMHGASHVSSPPFIVCEDATNGDLSDFLSRSEENSSQMWRLLYEAALGLEYIHSMDVVHGDLKLNNILVASNGQAKLSDFGLSSLRTCATLSKTSGESQSGGLRWRAPECLKKRPTFESDVYSFAMCMIEAATGEPPFSFLDDDSVRDNLKNGEIPDQPDEMTDEMWELVVSMTDVDPKKRISLQDMILKLKNIEKMKNVVGFGIGSNQDNVETLQPESSLLSDSSVIASRVPRHEVKVRSLISDSPYEDIYWGTYCREPVAIKMMSPEKRSDPDKVDVFLAEVKMMADLNHPHIVQYVGVSWTSLDDLCVLTELMKGGDLRTMLNHLDSEGHPQGINYDKLRIAFHVAQALTYLHSFYPVRLHHNLKSKNVLLTENLDAKLADFGLSRELEDHTVTAGVGTPLWMAPEVMMGERYDEKIDIFSFGVVLSELDLQSLPYANA